MFRKVVVSLGLLGATALSGCVVYAPPPPRAGYVYVDAPPPAVVVAPVPIVPVYGFYGGYYHGGWYRGGGRWR